MARINLTEQRLATLELMLLWEGFLKRSRLAELLGLGDIRASQLIQEFRDQYPLWMTWNTKSRSYHATQAAYKAINQGHQTIDRAESLSRYLNLVGLPYVTENMESGGSICAAFPNLSTPSPEIFAALSQAIRLKQSVEITYCSMGEPTPHKRTISPHHLVRAGRRWHIRAFSSKDQDFMDYALGRIVSVNSLNTPQEQGEEHDAAWNSIIPVRLIAHPDLSREQEEVIRFEYFNNTAASVVSCRGALIGYFIQDIKAAIDTTKQTPPDYQFAVENTGDVKGWIYHEGM
jgi:predicted DNA-binding transcriptional regulator YafY